MDSKPSFIPLDLNTGSYSILIFKVGKAMSKSQLFLRSNNYIKKGHAVLGLGRYLISFTVKSLLQ